VDQKNNDDKFDEEIRKWWNEKASNSIEAMEKSYEDLIDK